MLIIYMITGPTGKRYFGQTSRTIAERWREHRKSALKENPTYYLHRAMRKHGRDSFTIEPLVIIHNKTDLDLYEQFAIDTFKTRDPKFGYNTAPGGRGGDRPECHTPEALEKRRIKYSLHRPEDHPRYRHVDTDRIRELYLSGSTIQQIANTLEYDDTTVWRRVHKMGITRTKEEQNEQIAKTMAQVRKNVFWSCNAPLHPDREKGWWKRNRRRYVPETEGAQ